MGTIPVSKGVHLLWQRNEMHAMRRWMAKLAA
jgi:hypothetical protein